MANCSAVECKCFIFYFLLFWPAVHSEFRDAGLSECTEYKCAYCDDVQSGAEICSQQQEGKLKYTHCWRAVYSWDIHNMLLVFVLVGIH